MILVLSQILLYFENNGQSSQYKKMKKMNAIAFAEKYYSFPKNSRF